MEHYILTMPGADTTSVSTCFKQQLLAEPGHLVKHLKYISDMTFDQNVPSVLLIDDDPAGLVEAYDALHETFQCFIFQWTGIEKAVEAIRYVKPWLFVIDMSGDWIFNSGTKINFDGYKVIEQVRRDPDLCAISFVIFSNYDPAEMQLQGIDHARSVCKQSSLSEQELQVAADFAARDFLNRQRNMSVVEAKDHLTDCRRKYFNSVSNETLLNELKKTPKYIVCESKKMSEVLMKISRCAKGDFPVLITGEPGTGKGVVAREIHFQSSRADKPFVHINCGALHEQLLESELFGHIKGAFTGATADKTGRFEYAKDGTVFLDEITETSEAFQIKLLRAVKEKEFEPVGSTETKEIKSRVIAATNRDIQLQIKKKEFRDDLYHRLAAMEITLPPLRDRKEDIPVLVKHFLVNKPKQYRFDNTFLNTLRSYNWPGNIHELENVIERVAIKEEGNDGVVRLASADLYDIKEKFNDDSGSMDSILSQLKAHLAAEFNEEFWENWARSVGSFVSIAKLGGQKREIMNQQTTQEQYYKGKVVEVMQEMTLPSFEEKRARLLNSTNLQKCAELIQQKASFNDFTNSSRSGIFSNRPPNIGQVEMTLSEIWSTLLQRNVVVDLAVPLLSNGLADHSLKCGLIYLAMLALKIRTIYEFELLRLFFSLRRSPRNEDAFLTKTKILVGAFCPDTKGRSREFFGSIKGDFLLGVWDNYRNEVLKV